jgi:DNA-binding LacI/PurR family transcriptional regulator
MAPTGPPLTSARVPAFDIGWQAGALLIRRLAGDATCARRVELAVTVMERESTAR